MNLTNKHLKHLLPIALRKIVADKEQNVEGLLKGWSEIVGSKEAQMTKAVSFSKGTLLVIVKTAVLYSLLEQIEKPKLLLKLQKKFPEAGLKKIIFRVGA